MEERLEHIRKKMKGRRVYYSSYAPGSAYLYEVEDAEDDMLWLISEVERLRSELSGRRGGESGVT
jgi:hypothetical protein